MNRLPVFEFACMIPKYRKMKNMSQADLARAVGCSKNTISSLERREFYPSLPLAVKLAYVLDTDLNCLFVARVCGALSADVQYRFDY